MTENWVSTISNKIDEQIDLHISVRDYRFYQIEKLKRIAKHLNNDESCLECKYARKELETIVLELDRLINKSGVNKSEYEKKVESLLKHLKDKHKVFQAHYFTYTYSATYTFFGAGLGLLLSYGIFYSFNPSVFFLTSGIGMFAGNVLGSRKDRILVREGKQI
ncbi:hypothetical protein [Labilibaculum manganireducens]|uniref:Uncharacterized protein n=1 Tax=Labilibaculum manganireducens TaxID=1940525 RepID=A0A2N3HR27_9BACT|nr:hypothetical protein [Labilibaculum manganireducens]PKQ60511.1 hypothetical protein BZG01_20895 [Labilibaculum manganireducens]